MTANLEANGITKRIGATAILDDVSISVEAGQVTVVLGPNGAGKTTLFDCISGAGPADAGTVRHLGVDVTRWSSDRRSRHGVARTFQRTSVFPTLTVADNLRIAAENRTRRSILGGLLGLPDRGTPGIDRIVHAHLAALGLAGTADVRAGNLPSGTMRLVELARALCTQPDTLLLDEPASGLDDRETDAFHDIVLRLARSGMAILMVEHDLGLVRSVADSIHVLSAGRTVVHGPAASVLDREDVQTLLTGRVR
ncbi:MAG: transporter related [Ilumatobacteraceae bacterium]|nr:transporter related [Ilumatobacteraceae bacterium]